MSDAEREVARRRIGNDLYEIFMRIKAELDDECGDGDECGICTAIGG